ncbi:MAG: hypothetical protein Q8N53_19680, partial [Longimicrobiales bacterium]|nr:hypothetical protein [Longimicrobiales bacterium]
MTSSSTPASRSVYAAALFLAALALLPSGGGAQEEHEAWLRTHYDKTEHMVSMRDGVRLYTIVYAPKDRSRTYPILLLRTPYSI